MAMVPYVVQQGEYLAKLAFRFGFDPDQVWDAPENAALKAARKDPNILAPGDVLYRPDQKPAPLDVVVGSANAYAAKVPEMPIKLRLFDERDKPHAGAACTVEGLGETQHHTADGDGVLTLSVPVTTGSFFVTVDALGYTFQASIGVLDPKTDASGRKMRLANLGFPLDAMAGEAEDEARRLDAALAAFQAVYGVGGDDPWEHLAKIHGC